MTMMITDQRSNHLHGSPENTW